MDAIELSRALVPVAAQEHLVRRRFWKKIKSALGRLPFAEQLVAAYYAAVDPATPARVKVVLFAALAYFITPVDLLPDVLIGGFADDVALLLGVVESLGRHITERHLALARRWLEDETASRRDSVEFG